MRKRVTLTSFGLLLLSACSTASSGSSTIETATLADETQAVTTNDGAAADHARSHDGHAFKHVLLLSIDGLHQQDLVSFIASNPHSALAKLGKRGIRYDSAFVNRLDGTPTNPSDSFPGLLALATGGSSPTHGGWYDVSYARDLFAYSADAPCAGAPGTAVTYDESVDADDTHLWGSATDDTPTHRVTVARSRIDVTKLPYAKNGNACRRS